ncbi:MAG: cytidine deaminase [Chloroflexaceae bacterium]|jgi:cytidine deaminase|nr:cytidine deaminase [Chloroflexaceae bacterium]MCE2851250.1 cytidine deaminase [Chloroflexaceae bacterium]
MMSQINRQQLIDAAITARTHAYAPYSRFLVGAAVLCRDGRIFMGCNIENAAYPSTNCAERVAMQSAWAVGARDIIAIAVVADTPGPVSPCGGCRQVMAELAQQAIVYLTNLHGQVYETSVPALLPGAFDPSDLPQ